jgi:hypothetical protein
VLWTVPPLPAVAPGQLWLTQLSQGGEEARAVAHALDGVDVVVYDRPLEEFVGRCLPLGSYAEPASTAEGAAARCVRFVRDGWSVVRLLPAQLTPRERTRRIQHVIDELATARVPVRMPATIFATADGIEERIAVQLEDLAAIVASFPRDARLAIVIDALGAAAPAKLRAIAANGLAG